MYSLNPSYYDLIVDTYKSVKYYYREDNWKGYTFPLGFITEFKRLFYFPLNETYSILVIAILFTIIRYFFETSICKPLVKWLKFDLKSDRLKFPESLWKFVAYCFLWSYSYYVLILSGKYDYFEKPFHVWNDWTLGMEIPFEIKWLYFIECGFYVHSVYATIYMDTKRKDFLVMLIHHFLTMTLIIVTYATRYQKVGVMVLFVHDITDILLEFTKCNVYLRKRNGKFYSIHEYLSNCFFIIFTLVWFVFRLYWFPLKILYTSSVVSVYEAVPRGAGLYTFLNSLMWFLLGLNLYWFYFIIAFLYKVLFNKVGDLEDTRDYTDSDEDEKKKNS